VIEQAKIKRQVWKSKNPNDPSNKILCGFHLSDEITNNFRVTLGKFKEYSDFMEFMRDHSPVPVEDFYSNIATSYWTGEVPEFIDDNTCISVPLDDKFPNRAYEMGIYFEDIINSGVEADLNEEIIKRFGQEVEPDFSRGRKLKFRKNLIHLFDLTLKEAKEKFEMIYYFKKTKKHRNAGQEKLAELFGFSSTQSLRDMQSRLGIKPVKKKKKKDNAK
jgi:hypothetical protein